MKRLFIALPLPKAICTTVDTYLQPYKNHASLKSTKWVEEENRHLTLLFLGEVQEKRLAEIREFIRGVCGRMQPFQIDFDSITLFPTKTRAKMLWMRYKKSLAFEEFVGELRRYLLMVLPSLEEEEEKSPLPHITLARLKTGVDPKSLSFKPLTLAPLIIDQASLYESTLSPEGSTYTLLETFSYGS